VTRLINALQTLLAVEPQSVRDHPLASRLAAKNEPMQLTQLLGRQGRTEIPVALADDRQRPSAKRLGLATIARTTAPLRPQRRLLVARSPSPAAPQAG
jgi:hypothetical protein